MSLLSGSFDPDLDVERKVGVPGHLWLAQDEAFTCHVCDDFGGCLVHSRCIDCGDVSHWPGESEYDSPFVVMHAAALVGGIPFRCPECRRR